jgi:Protein of unknown function (DUF4235)
VEEAMNKLLYKALGLLASMLASMLAGAIFKKVWKLAPGPDEAPEATDTRRGWGEILLAAALQGAIFALIRAAFDRAAAEGVRQVTGDWPGEGEPAGDEGQQARSLAGPVLSRPGLQLSRSSADSACGGCSAGAQVRHFRRHTPLPVRR